MRHRTRGRGWQSARRRVFELDNYRCVYCGHTVYEDQGLPARLWTATVDHVIPVACGGRSVYRNMVTSCSRDNRLKGKSVREIGHLISEERLHRALLWDLTDLLRRHLISLQRRAV